MFLSVENIATLESKKYISKEDFKKEFKHFPEKGDVLMTRIGDVGRANVVTSEEDLAYYVSLALIKSKNLVPGFLCNNIRSESMQREIWRKTLHIAFPKKINKGEIENLQISSTSREEQERISKIMQAVEKTITLHQRNSFMLVNLN